MFPDVVFSVGDSLTRSILRKEVQTALTACKYDGLPHTLHWREMSYTPERVKPKGVGDALQQLLHQLSGARNEQFSPEVSPDSAGVVTEIGASAPEQHAGTGLLAAEFADAITEQADARPLDVLMSAHDRLTHSKVSKRASPSDHTTQKSSEAPAIEIAYPCLLLLRRAKAATKNQPPLVIAHTILGDHRGFGRLWNLALHQSDMYALRHRGLTGAHAFTIDVEGATRMVGEYATALVTAFTRYPFDLVGASFGAVLALHVWHAARAAGGFPRRLVFLDPPPAVPRELPVPKMLTDPRLAAMGVLSVQLKIEMGASMWELFPQLKTLPKQALAYFVAAQCLPEGTSRDDMGVGAERFRRLLPIYQQCRHALHTLAVNIEAVPSQPDGSPTVLMVLASERWPTFREMFPGIKEDTTVEYGRAAVLQLPGKHLEMVSRCIENRDDTFTGVMERFLSDSFSDAWWWGEHLPKAPKDASSPRRAVPSAARLNADDMIHLLSALTPSTAAPTHCVASGPGAVEVATAIQGVAREFLQEGTTADAPLMEAGLDSLGAAEFQSRLSKQLSGVKLPATLIFDFPTLRQVEAHTTGLLVASHSNAAQSTRHDSTQDMTADRLRLLLSSLAGTAAPTHCVASGPGAVEVATAIQGVAREFLQEGTTVDAPLMEAGLDSLGAAEFQSRLSKQLSGVKLPATLIFDFPTLRQVEAHTTGLLVASHSNAAAQSARHDSIQDTTADSLRLLLSSLAGTTVQGPVALATAQACKDAAPCIHGVSCKLGGGARDVASFHDGGKSCA